MIKREFFRDLGASALGHVEPHMMRQILPFCDLCEGFELATVDISITKGSVGV